MKWYWEDLTGGVEEVVWSRKKGGWWAAWFCTSMADGGSKADLR